MNPVYEKLDQCCEAIRKRLPFRPRVALVLGSGLGDYGEHIRVEKVIEYREIPGFPVSTIPGHRGRFLFGYEGDVPLVVMQGRVHFYEGYAMSDVVLPIRLMKRMGAEVLFLTNASGGVNLEYGPGDFMIIRDQIASFVPSPLIGENMDELGVRFPDMSQVYDKNLSRLIRDKAGELNILVREGTYLQFTGPAYETPAEVKMARVLGADAVGMSTACEAVAARHMGMKICGISCITNMACGILECPLDHLEVQKAADMAAPKFRRLVGESIREIGREFLGIPGNTLG